jgi:hypothetical protein
VSGFVLFSFPTLWAEYQALRNDWDLIRRGTPLAFIDISPSPSFAHPPEKWVYRDGDSLMLWSGWHGDHHGWFRARVGDLDPEQLHQPLGRDFVRAIDQAIVEVGAGSHWKRMQPDTPVVGLDFAGVETAYPLLLLQKVEIVNDTINGRPVVVICTPFLPDHLAVQAFDPVLDGQRLTFGVTGHFRGAERRPLLYDRQTESLWIIGDDTLSCLAGRHKGVRLKSLAQPAPMRWDRWQASQHGGRLVVGAERGLGRSKLPPGI